jgi:PKD repeat protein
MDGIHLLSSVDILVHHNYIDTAPNQSFDDGANAWDDGYPSGGNYWTDYVGVDDCSGPDQDICTGGDGIGDTNYTIDGDSVDRYPLMAPYEDSQPPLVAINSPTEGEDLDTVSINVTGVASDAGLSGLALVEVRINSGSWTPASGTFFWSARVSLTLGDNTIEARSTDGHGNTALAMVNVTFTNEPPTASFTVSPATGNTTTAFSVDASGSTDPEDLPASLEVRWDWEDDGTWDTAWSTTKTATHTYGAEGAYTIRLEVRDTGGNTNSTTLDVDVSDITEEDGEDELPMTLLGIVAIVILIVIIAAATLVSRMRRAPPEEEAPLEEEPAEDVPEEEEL